MNKNFYLLTLAVLFLSKPAFAYIGPGAALGLIGSALGFSSIVVVSIILSIAWPLWWVFKKVRKKRKEKEV